MVRIKSNAGFRHYQWQCINRNFNTLAYPYGLLMRVFQNLSNLERIICVRLKKPTEGIYDQFFSIGHIDVSILNGQMINGVLEWFDYRNTIEGIELRLQFPKD
jgi:hypothetical protein